MHRLKQGYIQIYTGNGKGKSTAAIGQAMRAAGHGLKSYILLFMKDFPYGEAESLKSMSEFITIAQVGKDDFVFNKELPPQEEIDKAKYALEDAKQKMLSGKYDLVILDEVCVSIYFGLFTVEDVLQIVGVRPENVELILTGRYCPKELIDAADLVTEMKEIKHYYQNGILARKGIES
jgi:cob(I)alamin adenosyltransferase